MRLELRCPVFTVLLRTTKYAVSALFLHEIKTLLIFTSLITPTVEVKDSQMKMAAILDAAFQMPVCQCISTSSFFHQQQVYQLTHPQGWTSRLHVHLVCIGRGAMWRRAGSQVSLFSFSRYCQFLSQVFVTCLHFSQHENICFPTSFN